MDKIKYYLKRVLEAGPLSISLIIFYKIKKWLWFYIYKTKNKPYQHIDKFKFIDSYSSETAMHLMKNMSNYKNDDTKLIDLVMNNRFPCLGYGIAKIPHGIGWHEDQFHNKSWELKYFNKIDFVTPEEFCDVKVPWELSRLQFLNILAISYLDTKNKKVLKKYNAIIDDWIDNNPPGYGINWVCTMEVAIRATNMVISYLLMFDFLNDEIKEKLKNSIIEHHQYIQSFPELSDVPGNHYLSNLMGKYICEYVIFGHENKKTDKTYSQFVGEAKKQFLSDGCHFEMSPTYHRLCLDMIAIVLSFRLKAKNDKNSNDSDLISIFKKGLDFCNDIAPEKMLPIFGDNDGGHILWLGTYFRDYSVSNEFYNFFFKKRIDKTFKNETLLLLSIANIKTDINFSLDNKKHSFAVERSGYLSAYINGLSAVMRVGNQGLKGRASHDHDDALQLWLSLKDEDILTDRGCHSYTLSKNIRYNNIVSSAHNVVRPKNDERYLPVKGSINQTIRGAATARNSKYVKKNSNHCIISAKLKRNHHFLNSERSVEINYNSQSFKTLIKDKWERKAKNGIELSWYFAKNYLPKITKSHDNLIELILKGRYSIIVKIKSKHKIKGSLFDYELSENYGSKENCKGILVASNQKESSLLTEIVIDMKGDIK